MLSQFYFNGKCSYYSQVSLVKPLYKVLKMIINSKELISKIVPTITEMI